VPSRFTKPRTLPSLSRTGVVMLPPRIGGDQLVRPRPPGVLPSDVPDGIGLEVDVRAARCALVDLGAGPWRREDKPSGEHCRAPREPTHHAHDALVPKRESRGADRHRFRTRIPLLWTDLVPHGASTHVVATQQGRCGACERRADGSSIMEIGIGGNRNSATAPRRDGERAVLPVELP
jgi:hypothetical protein